MFACVNAGDEDYPVCVCQLRSTLGFISQLPSELVSEIGSGIHQID